MKKDIFSNFKVPEEVRIEAEKKKRAVLADPDIKAFISENRLTVCQVERATSRFMEYHKLKTDPESLYKGVLEYHKGQKQVQVRWEVKDVEHAMRIADGVRKSIRFDEESRGLRGLGFNDLEITKDNDSYVRAFHRMVKEYKYKDDLQGIWLAGAYGVGKTYLMGAVANAFHRKGASVLFTSVESMLSSIRDAFDYERGLARKRIDELKKVEVLFLDDVGTERLTEWGYSEVLYAVLNYRMNNKKPTFFTSNLSVDDYADLVSKQLKSDIDGSRLRERVLVLAREFYMGGDNRRR